MLMCYVLLALIFLGSFVGCSMTVIPVILLPFSIFLALKKIIQLH